MSNVTIAIALLLVAAIVYIAILHAKQKATSKPEVVNVPEPTPVVAATPAASPVLVPTTAPVSQQEAVSPIPAPVAVFGGGSTITPNTAAPEAPTVAAPVETTEPAASSTTGSASFG